jgi:hypothetical protein
METVKSNEQMSVRLEGLDKARTWPYQRSENQISLLLPRKYERKRRKTWNKFINVFLLKICTYYIYNITLNAHTINLLLETYISFLCAFTYNAFCRGFQLIHTNIYLHSYLGIKVILMQDNKQES